LLAGSAEVVVAGGMESMSNAPYLLEKARSGYRMGHGQIIDHMFFDGLEDAYERGRLMGTFAEECASFEGFSRQAQDAFAKTISQDEQPPKARLDKIPELKPAFREGGTVTAANSSSISDGAAALTLMRQSEATRR
nr:acetyl-CoA acetyltransferase, cytosolic 1 [Tanacetum cinerariifolium]